MKRKVLIAALVLLVAAAITLTVKWRALVARQQFTFIDVPEGKRAPSSEAFGFQVGTTTLAEVQQRTSAKGFTCRDDGMSQLVKRGVSQMVEEKSQKGESTIAYRLYGWLNPHGQNPQVRWACEEVPAEALDRQGPAGRLLFVFDAPDVPLRHVSFAQSYEAKDDAVREFINTGIAMGAVFAPDGPLPKPPSSEPLKPHEVSYTFSDRQAKVAFVDLGRAVTLTESLEVPFPVRVR